MRARGVFRALVAAVMVVTALVAAAPSQAGMVFAPAYSVPNGVDPVHAPIYATAPPGDSSRLFIVERAGRIRVAVDGVLQNTPFLDIQSSVWQNSQSEAGLLSAAFAPDYASSRKFYVYFVEPPDAMSSNGDIRIEEFQQSSGNANVADLSTRRLILEIPHDEASNHYGGQLQFGPGGKLYAGTGDGGGGGNQFHHAQDPGSNLGKLLAIDPGTPPVVSQAAIGLRNPFRFSFDRANGDLLIGDVGQDKWEEIDWVPAPTLSGLNFGWSCYEGNEARDALSTCPAGPLTFPIQTYPNPPTASTAVTGGVVVRDPALTSLVGRYIYADFFAGRVRSLQLASPNAAGDRQEDELPKVSQLVAFGEDASGHVYVVSLGGPVYRIACDTTCDPPASGGGGGGGNPPPAPGPGPEQPPAPPVAPNPDAPPAATDRTAPRLVLRARRVQHVARVGRLRLAALCSEACSIRVTARASSALRRSLPAHSRSTIELRSRLRRATRVTITVRATDGAGNAAVSRLVVRLKR